MKIKNNLKLLIILEIALFSMLFIGTTKVNAAEYSDSNKNLIITIDKDLRITGTKTECISDSLEYTEGINEGDLLNRILITGVNQDKLNEYSKTTKTFQANIKRKLPSNDIEKAIWVDKEYVDGEAKYTDKEEIEIVTINGNKYLSYTCELKYNNIPYGVPVDDNIKVMSIHSGPGGDLRDELSIKLVKNDSNYNIYSTSTIIDIYSENQPFNYSHSYVNKYGQKYPTLGGLGGGPDNEDKWYQTSETDVKSMFGFGYHYGLPTNVSLAEAYFQLEINVYQGEKIDVENLGTLYYSGIKEISQYNIFTCKEEPTKVYLYKNSLDNLKKLTDVVTFKAKGKSGYTYSRNINYGYKLTDDVQEETVTGKINTTNKDVKLNMIINGYGNAKFQAIEIQKDDMLYAKLEKGLKETVEKDYTYINLGTFDINVVEGAYNGNLTITFDVGTEFNGKKYVVGHLKNGLDYESFNGIVENGKITITVDSLSPFMVSLIEEKQIANDNTQTSNENEVINGNKLDETPKTGNSETVITIFSLIAIVSLAGIIIIKNKERKRK